MFIFIHETVPLNVTDHMFRATNRGLYTSLILLNYSKRFDMINFDMLLSILKYVCTLALVLKLPNCLIHISQSVSLHKVLYNLLVLEKGVPHCSILGPILLTIYSSTNFIIYFSGADVIVATIKLFLLRH